MFILILYNFVYRDTYKPYCTQLQSKTNRDFKKSFLMPVNPFAIVRGTFYNMRDSMFTYVHMGTDSYGGNFEYLL
jgi:hypothetical protein